MAAAEKTVDTEKVTLTPDQQRDQLDQAIEKLDKHSESQLEMARLFIARGKPEIARRRLEEILELYGKSNAAKEARSLLKRL